MGTWGTGPFDDDAAADLIASLTKHVDLVVTRKTDATASYHYAQARAVIPFLVLSHDTDILGGPGLEPALRALVRMRTDDVWLSGWREPKKIAKALDRELTLLVARMALCKYCRKKLGGRGVHAQNLRALAETAKIHRVPSGRRPPTPAEVRRARARLRRRLNGVVVLASGRPPHEKAARTAKLPKKKARAGRRRGS